MENEIPAATGGIEIIDLVGLPMMELRRRVASLPDRTAIVYTGIYSDGHGTHYSPVEALGLFAEGANAPIVASAETFVGRGSVGGFVMIPTTIGQEAARLALRILEIVCASWVSDGDLALLPIQDSGPGIAPDQLERIFEPFFTTKKQGMGTGLCIARNIIESCGGTLSAEGRPSGAVFHVRLPLARTA